MWQLRGRDYGPRHEIKEWSEYGEFQRIADAVTRINELEGNKDYDSIFLQTYVDPTGGLPGTDTDVGILSRFQYSGRKTFYVLFRVVQSTGSAPDISVGSTVVAKPATEENRLGADAARRRRRRNPR